MRRAEVARISDPTPATPRSSTAASLIELRAAFEQSIRSHGGGHRAGTRLEVGCIAPDANSPAADEDAEPRAHVHDRAHRAELAGDRGGRQISPPGPLRSVADDRTRR